MHASRALANLCARHSGSARDAAMRGACELLLAAYRQHFHDALVQGNALLAVARIIESHPASSARAAGTGVTPLFTKALKRRDDDDGVETPLTLLLDDDGMAHVAAALAQLHTLAISDEPCPLPTISALVELLQRYPASAAGSVRAGAADAFSLLLRTSPQDAALQAAGSCAMGCLLLSQPHYAVVVATSGAVKLLLVALRTHPGELEVQLQASRTLAIMAQTLSSSATAIYEGGGDKLLAEAARLHPHSEDLKVNVSTAFRILGKHVPELPLFPFVPAEAEIR